MHKRVRAATILIAVVSTAVVACAGVTITLGDPPSAEPASTSTAPAAPPPVYVTATMEVEEQVVSAAFAVNPTDGIKVMHIPAGTFNMGSNSDFSLRRGFCLTPRHKVTLHEYWIDQTEVTVRAFRKFIEDTGYTTDAEKNGNTGWVWSYCSNDWEKVGGPDQGPNWRKPIGGKKPQTGLDDHPVTQVSWNDATAFCEWAGGRLPTEAEWERAARGDKGAPQYPWGDDEPDENLVNFGEKSFACRLCDVHFNDGYQYTAPVGSFPEGVSPFGLLDMAGNAFEWVQDSYTDGSCYPRGAVTDPEPPEDGEERMMRGGSYAEYDGLYWKLRVDNRWSRPPGSSFADTGMRCAYDTQP